MGVLPHIHGTNLMDCLLQAMKSVAIPVYRQAMVIRHDCLMRVFHKFVQPNSATKLDMMR